MKLLAIETSCDETAVAVLEASDRHAAKGEPRHGRELTVLSNVISSQIALHAQYGGVVPNLASREHVRNIKHVFEGALKEAGVSMHDIDLIVVTNGPGLGPCLLVGLTFAKTLAWHYDKPLVGVNHMDGHIHSNWLEPVREFSNLQFPILNLVVSGGHTEIVLMRDHDNYEILGETLDDAVGEAFDKAARLLGLGYPGGPAIAKLASGGDPSRFPLPQPLGKSKDYNFSYSGLKTAVLYLLRDLKEKAQDEQVKKDVAASFQDSAINVLIDKTMRAAQEHEVNGILLSGGVSANTLLRERLAQRAQELDLPFFCPKMIYTTDNAAMIGAAGYFKWLSLDHKTPTWNTIRMDANMRL